MTTPFTTFLINPHDETITEVTYQGHYTDIYKHIDCDAFDVVSINKHNDGLFVDDEGLFKPSQSFFKHADYPTPLAGKALVMGCDDKGESVAPKITLQELIDKISFVTPIRVNDQEIIWMDHNGQIVHITE